MSVGGKGRRAEGGCSARNDRWRRREGTSNDRHRRGSRRQDKRGRSKAGAALQRSFQKKRAEPEGVEGLCRLLGWKNYEG